MSWIPISRRLNRPLFEVPRCLGVFTKLEYLILNQKLPQSPRYAVVQAAFSTDRFNSCQGACGLNAKAGPEGLSSSRATAALDAGMLVIHKLIESAVSQ
jgi:hypothetical protein